MCRVQVAIIGSGPGGSMSAALLAEAGYDVCLIEEGPSLSLDSCRPFSGSEMQQKYRNAGLTVAFGTPKLSYAEGRCVGGGSEINSALFHRTPAAVLEEWQQSYLVEDLDSNSLAPHFQAIEFDLSVQASPLPIPESAVRLQQGAKSLGWVSQEVPRCFAYPSSIAAARKQSMTETLIPRAKMAGARVFDCTRVTGLKRQLQQWSITATRNCENSVEPLEVKADYVFVCAGAIQTASLLQRNHLSPRAGQQLCMHPSIKLTARFHGEVNTRDAGVAAHQVKEFAPRFSLGCSISSPPYLALALTDMPGGDVVVRDHWRSMATYYAMVRNGIGHVRKLPWLRDPLVYFDLGEQGFINVLEGMDKLAECLFAAGAHEVYTATYPTRSIRSMNEMRRLKNELLPSQLALMTIHLFSSCPMGNDLARCVTDSYGQVHGQDDLYVNDASLLCTAPGVNPQGTIMAIARRNILHFIATHSI